MFNAMPIKAIIAFFLFFFVCTTFSINVWTMIGLLYTIYILYKFIDCLGKTVPILELILLISSIQWVLAPFIEYLTSSSHPLCYMYITESTYMSYAVPCILAMHLGVLFQKRNIYLYDIENNIKLFLIKYPIAPYIMILLGFFFSFLFQQVRGNLSFVFYLISNVKYIGIIYLLFSKSKKKWMFLGLIILFALLSSISSGMFHDLILWSALLSSFICKELKFNMVKKAVLLIIGFFVILNIQLIKQPLRDVVWNNSNLEYNEISLAFGILENEWSKNFDSEIISDLNIRLNQGWIISKIMYSVPDEVPYGKGETIIEAISAAIVPRFIDPNKPISGGKKNFEKYTQIQLDDASMGISLAGEGYINFGKIGGIFFVFLWGLFLGIIWRLVIRLSKKYSTFIIWSPLLFLQAIKAETELLDVLNHIVKTFILILIVFYILKKSRINI